VFEGLTRFVREFRRVKNASADLRRAYALYNQKRFAETADLLKRVRATSDRPGNNPVLSGAHCVARLRAATLLSMAAAKLGDTAAATDAIAEGQALWNEIKGHMRPGDAREKLAEWDAWAQRYIERLER
jgi:hypothetical protein